MVEQNMPGYTEDISRHVMAWQKYITVDVLKKKKAKMLKKWKNIARTKMLLCS